MDAASKVILSGILTTFVAPGVVVLAVGLITTRSEILRAGRASTLTTLAAILVGFFAIRGLPIGMPVDTLDWLPWLLLPAAALGWFEARGAEPQWLKPSLAFMAFLCGCFYLLLAPLLARDGSAWLPWAGLLTATAIAYACTVRVAPKVDASSGFAVLSCTALAGCVSVATNGSALLGQLMASIATVTGVLACLSLVRPLALGLGALAVVCLAIGGLVLYAWAYSELPLLPAFLTLATPLTLLAAKERETRRGSIIAALRWALIPAALAISVALWTGLGTQDQEPSSPTGDTQAAPDDDSTYRPY